MSEPAQTPPKRKPFSRYVEGLKTGQMPDDLLDEARKRPRIQPRAVVVGQRPRPHVPTVDEIRRRTGRALHPAGGDKPESPQGTIDSSSEAANQEAGPPSELRMTEAPEPQGPKRKPFEKYVAGVKSSQTGPEGSGGAALPGSSPSGARYQLSTRTRLTSVLAMLALVIGAILYLDNSAHQLEQEEAAARAQSLLDLAPAPASGPEVPDTPLGPIWIDAYQYTDPADERPPEAKKDQILEYGDFLTVVPKGRGKKWIYYALMGTDNRMRLTRYFSPEVISRQLPPLKITIREKLEGKVQVLVIASRIELPHIAEWVQTASYLEVPPPGDLRLQRFGHLTQLLQKNLKAAEVAVRLLPAIDYRPTPLPPPPPTR